MLLIFCGLLSFFHSCVAMEGEEQSSFLSTPPEIKTGMLHYLDLPDLNTLSLVCRDFNDVVKDNQNMRSLTRYDTIIHPRHALYQSNSSFTYYQLFSAHHHWIKRQDSKDDIDPLFYANLEMGNEYALGIFYPVFYHYLIGHLLHSEKATQRYQKLGSNYFQPLVFYADQGSHKAQNNLILSFLLLFLLIHDESCSFASPVSVPPLVPLMKKYADEGNSFVQVLLCDFYLDTSMATEHPAFRVSPPQFLSPVNDMKQAFLPGRLHNLVLPKHQNNLYRDVGLMHGITYAIQGNHFLQEQMLKIFFQGKYGLEVDGADGEFLLNKLFAKPNPVVITPLLKILPPHLNKKYRPYIQEKLIQEAEQGSESAQRTLIKSFAYGFYALEKSPMKAEKYGRKFKLPPRKKKTMEEPTL